MNEQRLKELQQGIDRTHETSREMLQAAALLEFNCDQAQIGEAGLCGDGSYAN